MIYEKRVVSTTVWGVIFGFILWALLTTSGKVTLSGAVSIILYQALMGFVIGISAWKISWWLHGLLIGLFFSLPLAFSSLWIGMGWGRGFALTLVIGIVFGFLIETLTTLVFKAEMRIPQVEEKKEEKEE